MAEHAPGPAMDSASDPVPDLAPDIEAHAAALADYVEQGERRARAIGNRGALRYGDDGRLHADILDAYWQQGFYVFEDVIGAEELQCLRADLDDVLARAPVQAGSAVDAQGRPALGREFARDPYTFIKPLSDPWGGTELLGGRHAKQMIQPRPAADAPNAVPFILSGMCQIMPSGLRLYGHPGLLRIAAAINGDDFVPYNDAIFIKQARLGGAVAWHQDGVTHWDNPQWDEGIHGFNFQVQLYDCTPGNCLWVVPGTHKQGRIDIKALIAANDESEQLPDAVPLACSAGSVTVANRQILHASFPNTTTHPRMSLTFGFHRRRSVLGARGALSQSADEVYDEARIFERSKVVQVAIDARAQRYPHETRYVYEPFAGLEDDYRWDDTAFERFIRDYNLNDLSI